MASAVLGKRNRSDTIVASRTRTSKRRSIEKESSPFLDEDTEMGDIIVVKTTPRKRAALTVNDENAHPAGHAMKAPKTPSKVPSKSLAKRDVLSPAKLNTIFKATKASPSVVEKEKPMPQTPRHIRPGIKAITPRHRITVGSRPGTPKGLVTPRHAETPSSQPTVLSAAKALFTRSAEPGELVGRDAEKAQIDEFLRLRLKTRTGGCLYVSGPPGTGKSAMLGSRLEALREIAGKDVKVANINCVSIQNEKALYEALAGEFLEDSTGTLDDLKALFVPKSKASKQLSVVVLDEIDHLLTKDQELLHTLFEWSLVRNSRLILLGIANALDLTDRFLPRLKELNLSPTLLPFKPYSTEQIVAVITSRLRSLLPAAERESAPIPFMHPAAIQLCARKVSSSTGDLRKAFDICRAAIELVESELRRAEKLSSDASQPSTPSSHTPVRTPLGAVSNTNTPTQPTAAPKVLISHIARISSSAFTASSASRLSILNLQQKAVLCTLTLLEKIEGPSVTIPRLFRAYTTLCKRHAVLHPLQSSELTDVLSGLEVAGVVNFSKAGAAGTPRKRGLGDERRVSAGVREMDLLTAVAGVGGGILAGLWREEGF